MQDRLADTDFRALLWDREGGLWIGWGADGLQRLRPSSLISVLTSNEDGSRQQVDSVSSGPTKAVWIGTWSSLVCWQDGQVRTFADPAQWTSGLDTRPVLEDGPGQVWFGNHDRGLFTLIRDEIVHVSSADDGRTNWTVRALHEDRTGRLWIGSNDGLLEKRGDRFVRYTKKDGLLDEEVLGIQDSPDGTLWVGSAQGGLYQFRDGRFWGLSVREGLLGNAATPLLVEEDGTVWVGTEHGLNRIRGGQVAGSVTEREGLHDSVPFCPLDDGRILLGELSPGNFPRAEGRSPCRCRPAKSPIVVC